MAVTHKPEVRYIKWRNQEGLACKVHVVDGRCFNITRVNTMCGRSSPGIGMATRDIFTSKTIPENMCFFCKKYVFCKKHAG